MLAYWINRKALKTCLDHDDGIVCCDFQMTYFRAKNLRLLQGAVIATHFSVSSLYIPKKNPFLSM